MLNLLARKLENFVPLSAEDKRLLDNVVRQPRRVAANEIIVAEGEAPNDVHLILEGFACRYKLLEDGTRQIVAYLVPGDMCDLHVFILREMDHTIAALSPCAVVDIPRPEVIALTERPAIARALWWATLVDEGTLREWVLNVGRRPAEERVGHLLCELLFRLKSVGLADGASYELPLTQSELADTVSISSVHMNRVLQRLRRKKLITLRSGNLVILDTERLQELSGFNPNYLHLAAEKPFGVAAGKRHEA
jgi:CRP-like cAMP-binding protein